MTGAAPLATRSSALAIAACGCAAVAASVLFWSTRLGPGLTPDSLVYLLLARSLSAGDGFRYLGAPMTHYPPGYPVLLGLIGATSRETLVNARLLHAALYATVAVLVACAARRAAFGAAGAGALAALLYVGSPELLTLHAMAWSEPAFLALLLAALLLFSQRAAGGSRTSLVAGSACLALALLTRYAGVAFLPAVAGVLLAWGRRPLRERVLDATIAVSLAAAPLAAWLARNALLGSTTGRPLAAHPLGIDHLVQLAGVAGRLWGLGAHPAWALLAALPVAAFSVAIVRACRGRLGREAWTGHADALQTLLAASAVAYVGFVAFSISFVDADTPIDARTLAPLQAIGVTLASALPGLLGRHDLRRAAVVTAVALVALGILDVPLALREAARLRREGEGFETPYWRDSATLAALRAVPERTLVFTNGPEIVSFFAHANTRTVPASTARVSLLARPEFASEQTRLCEAARDGAVIAYLDGVSWRWEVPTAEELAAACRLRLERQLEDGAVYRAGAT